MKHLAFLSFLLLATYTVAFSRFSLPLTPSRKYTTAGAHSKRTIQADITRAASLCNGPVSVPAYNEGFSGFTISVGIGEPPRYYNLLFDSGSSNLVCGTNQTYLQTSTSIPTGENVDVVYGSLNFTGVEYLDQVILAPGLIITNQSLADALNFTGFGPVDGIIGVGPTNLTWDTLAPDGNETVPTVMDNLVSQGLIEKKVFSVYFTPSGNDGDAAGEVTFGGVNETLFEGDLTYVPLTKTHPSSSYWGVNMSSVTYGDQIITNTTVAGVFDTGSTFTYLKNETFFAYMSSISGAAINSTTGLVEIPDSSVPSMQPLSFLFDSQVLTLDVAAQLAPKSMRVEWGLDPSKHYSLINTLDFDDIFQGGLEFIMGNKVMERYYTVFDADAPRIGFAKTKYTFTNYDG